MRFNVGSNTYESKRVFCVGMNYVAHIRELNNEIPRSPVIFMKPATSLVPTGLPIRFPSHGRDLHYETEVVVLIGKEGCPSTPMEAQAAIGGLSLGLDMTLRDLQLSLRPQGHPWELCKAFDDSAPIGTFVPFTRDMELENLSFTGSVNGVIKQRGNTADLVFSIVTLVQYLAGIWSLQAGDLIYTGTPVGVGPVVKGDRLKIEAPWCGGFQWTIG